MRDPKAIHRHNFSSQPHSSPSSHFVHAKHKSRRYSCLDRRRRNRAAAVITRLRSGVRTEEKRDPQ